MSAALKPKHQRLMLLSLALVALKIREIAEASGVPVFEDVALARSMYSQVSVDSMIPSQFYQAVAELVRVIYAKKPPRPNPGIA